MWVLLLDLFGSKPLLVAFNDRNQSTVVLSWNATTGNRKNGYTMESYETSMSKVNYLFSPLTCL